MLGPKVVLPIVAAVLCIAMVRCATADIRRDWPALKRAGHICRSHGWVIDHVEDNGQVWCSVPTKVNE